MYLLFVCVHASFNSKFREFIFFVHTQPAKRNSDALSFDSNQNAVVSMEKISYLIYYWRYF